MLANKKPQHTIAKKYPVKDSTEYVLYLKKNKKANDNTISHAKSFNLYSDKLNHAMNFNKTKVSAILKIKNAYTSCTGHITTEKKEKEYMIKEKEPIKIL